MSENSAILNMMVNHHLSAPRPLERPFACSMAWVVSALVRVFVHISRPKSVDNVVREGYILSVLPLDSLKLVVEMPARLSVLIVQVGG